MFCHARKRAQTKGVPFDLDIEWVREKLTPGRCELTGIGFSYEPTPEFNWNPYAPCLDRIIPALGYVKTNVRVVCNAVNFARMDWGDEVMMEVAHALVRNKPAVSARAD